MRDPYYCPHCYPVQNYHLPKKVASLVDFYIGAPLGFTLNLLLPKGLLGALGRTLKRMTLNFSIAIGHIQLTDTVNRSHLNNRALVFWDEAKRRGLKILNLKLFSRHTEFFAFQHHNKKFYFEANPIFLLNDQFKQYARASRYDDKAALKKILLAHQLPCPQGRAFISPKRALAYGLKLGFPLIVKPAVSSLSCHVTLNIRSREDLEKAIKLAKKINYKFIVEQYIPGEVHRAIILQDQLVACVKREAASIIGDGKSSLEKLLDEKNKQANRGDPGQRHFTLFKVKITHALVKFLAEQDLKLNSVPAKGQRVVLSPKMNLGNGGDLTEVTKQVHPENRKLLEKTHQILNIPLSGLDFICKDVSLPWQEQDFAILENNSLPDISMHHFLSQGEPINVAGKIWDLVLGALS